MFFVSGEIFSIVVLACCEAGARFTKKNFKENPKLVIRLS